MTQAVTLAGLGSTTPTIVSPTLTSPVLGTPVSGSLVNCTDVNYTGFKNRIINGGMVIDQRNAGASVTPTASTYTVDRWVFNTTQASKLSIKQNAGAVTPPVGFSNYLGVTTVSAFSPAAGDTFFLAQNIEANNIGDLAQGTASASSFTISFYVYSSLTGAFSGSITNSGARSYPFSFTVSSANTWTKISVPVVGDTGGTWTLSGNTSGMSLVINLGCGSTYLGTANTWATPAGGYLGVTGSQSIVGTSGATFYITGVQLEKGSVATSFDQRAYSQELAMCQRYLPAFNSTGASQDVAWGFSPTTTLGWVLTNFLVTPRVPPTGIFVPDATKFSIVWTGGGGGAIGAGGILFSNGSYSTGRLGLSIAGAPTSGGAILYANGVGAQILWTGCEL